MPLAEDQHLVGDLRPGSDKHVRAYAQVVRLTSAASGTQPA
jgi:hypothetical protein